MRLRIDVDASQEWIEQVNGGITVDVTERGFHAVCDALADVGDVGDVVVVKDSEAAELDAMQATLAEAVELGDVEIVGTGADGRPTYTMTEQGKAKVRAMGGGS